MTPGRDVTAVTATQDFAMIRPILDTLLLSPVVSPQRSEGFSRALSAPLQETAATELVRSACAHAQLAASADIMPLPYCPASA